LDGHAGDDDTAGHRPRARAGVTVAELDQRDAPRLRGLGA
jgi:hypothetical protein